MHTIHRYDLDNRKLAYAWSHLPVRQPLVVLHGLGDSAIHTYAPRFAATSLRETPSLFIDLPGFGEGRATDTYPATLEAMAEDVATLLQSLGVENAPIFAHSMGANIAMLLAQTHANLCSRFVLGEPLLDPAQSVMAADIARHSEAIFLERRFPMLLRATSLQARRGDIAARAFLSTLQMANPLIMYRAAVSLIRPRTPDFLEMLRQSPDRAHLLVGERTETKDLDIHINGIGITRIPEAGHFMMVENDVATACAILEVVEDTPYERDC